MNFKTQKYINELRNQMNNDGVIVYNICPVCKSAFTDQREALKCRNEHGIENQTWFYCRICLSGWLRRIDRDCCEISHGNEEHP